MTIDKIECPNVFGKYKRRLKILAVIVFQYVFELKCVPVFAIGRFVFAKTPHIAIGKDASQYSF